MYTNPQNGQVAATTAAPTLHLGTYRRAIMSAMADEVFTPEERLRANHSVYECQDSARLALWLKNVTRVRGEREANSIASFTAALERGKELVASAPQYATMQQCDEIFKVASHSAILPCERSQAVFGLPTYTFAQAVRVLGRLYAKVLHRTGQQLYSDGSTQLTA